MGAKADQSGFIRAIQGIGLALVLAAVFWLAVARSLIARALT
jgi:hypothetical protein